MIEAFGLGKYVFVAVYAMGLSTDTDPTGDVFVGADVAAGVGSHAGKTTGDGGAETEGLH